MRPPPPPTPRGGRVRGRRSLRLAAALVAAVAASGCAASGDGAGDAPPAGDGGAVRVVASTSILGDVLAQLVGDDGEVTVLMGPGVDPHAFAPTPRDAAVLRDADLVVVNGLGLEAPMEATLAATVEAGVPVVELAAELDPLTAGHDDHDQDADHPLTAGHDDHDQDADHDAADHDAGEHDARDHDADDGHDHGPLDPHVWFDLERMADGVELLAEELAAVAPHVEDDEWAERGRAYAERLRALDDELAAAFAAVPGPDRVMVTDHGSLGYLAARYDIEVAGTLRPGTSTQAEADARSLAELIEVVEARSVRLVVTETTGSTRLAEQLVDEVAARTGMEVTTVAVATDALGRPGSPADSYLGLVRETATTIADHLAGER